MRYLSLFSGIGCGDIGLQQLLKMRCFGYVEIEPYCQKIIRQRQLDGLLSVAPIYGDIRIFINEGYAEQYKGMVDIVSGGFPCQPFSIAGKRRGESDERNMWKPTIDTIRIIQPRYAFLENVPGLLSVGYFGTILSDIYESGYDVKWTCLSASDCGASHKRERLWMLLSNAKSEQNRWLFKRRIWENITSSDISNSNAERLQELQGESKNNGKKQSSIIRSNWWDRDPSESDVFESRVGRVVNGCSNRIQRLKAIGNGQVPIVAANAFLELLTGARASPY